MSREFPDLLNPWKAADGRRTFEGTMPLTRMQRLIPLLAPVGEPGLSGDDQVRVTWGDAQFRADFAYDAQSNVTVEVWVEAELPLICQRTLRPYIEPVRRHSVLAVVENVAEQERLPDHYDPVWVEHGQLALLDVVEDELLLAVPDVPRDPAAPEVQSSTDRDEQAGETVDQSVKRPFAELSTLIQKRNRN
jgi:uncharacterized protein